MTVIVKPIVYGNTAQVFGSKRDSDGHTHRWTLYVRSLTNEDLSVYISRIQFRLHETYPNHIRVLHQSPFQIDESGWGEFDVQITLFFRDSSEKPITFYHHLKLFSSDVDVTNGKKALVEEFYDQLVFQDPSDGLYNLLTNVPSISNENERNSIDYEEKKIETLARIRQTRKRVREDIEDLTERLRRTQENLQRLRQHSMNEKHFPSGTFTSTISVHDETNSK